MLSILLEMYCRIINDRINACTESDLGDEQLCFRKEGAFVDQIFVLRTISQKYGEGKRPIHCSYDPGEGL